jgi:hypothetical protein
MMKTLKETMSPYMIRNICYSNFQSCLRYGIILCGGDNEINIFKLQKKVLQIISVVSNRTSYRQIFEDYNTSYSTHSQACTYLLNTHVYCRLSRLCAINMDIECMTNA